MWTGFAVSDEPLKLVTTVRCLQALLLISFNLRLFHKPLTTTTTVTLYHEAGKLKISFHAYSTRQHHGGFSANLQKLSISSTVHGPFTANPPLHWSSSIEGRRSPGWWAVVVPKPHATANTHTVDISWPTSLPACFYVCICCAFHSQQLHSSSGWYVPSSSSLRRAERQHEFLSKTNAPRRPNLSSLLWQFITGSKLYTPHNAHRHIHKNTDSTQKTRKKEQINLLQPAVCAFMYSTPFDSNPQEHETVCVPQEARKKKPTQISRLRNIWEQKQSNFTHQSEATQTGRDRKLLYRM